MPLYFLHMGPMGGEEEGGRKWLYDDNTWKVFPPSGSCIIVSAQMKPYCFSLDGWCQKSDGGLKRDKKKKNAGQEGREGHRCSASSWKLDVQQMLARHLGIVLFWPHALWTSSGHPIDPHVVSCRRTALQESDVNIHYRAINKSGNMNKSTVWSECMKRRNKKWRQRLQSVIYIWCEH